MRRPRVAMVLNSTGLGGVTEVAYQLLRLLPRDRFEPHVYFLKDSDPADQSRAQRLAAFASLGVGIGMPRSGGKLEAIADLSQWLADHDIQLLHTHSYRPNIYGRMAGALNRHRGMKIVAHYHNDYTDKWTSDFAALQFERSLAASTDAMIAVSRQVRTHVAGQIGIPTERIDIVENGVDAARFAAADRDAARRALGIAPGAVVVGTIGRICEQKGQDDLVEAAAGLHVRGRHLQFVMFGDIEDKPLYERLRQRIDSAGLATHVRFAGHISDAPAAYAAVDIVAVPSRWEGFPLVIAEAMAAGKPIVATSIGAVPDMTGDDAAILVPPRTPDRLADAIARLADEPHTHAGMGAAGRARSRALTWQTAANRVCGIYDRLLTPVD